MSTNLKKYLLRRRTQLEEFIEKNKITSYQTILDFCEKRGCDPISKKEFLSVKKKIDLRSKKDEIKVELENEGVKTLANEEKPAKPKRRRSKVSRSTQSSQEKRSSDKTVEDS